MNLLCKYKIVPLSILSIMFAPHLCAQSSASPEVNLFFINIFVSILLLIFHSPYILLSFLFAVNAHKFTQKEIKNRNILLSVYTCINLLFLAYAFHKDIYFTPVLLLITIPIAYFIIGNLKKSRPLLNWVLSILYISNIVFFVYGGSENYHGFGPKHGEYIHYYDAHKKKVRTIELYRYGCRDGAYKEFHENGQLSAILHYQNDTLSGPVKEYYDNGFLKASYHYLKNEVDGEFLSFYRNKKPESTRKFKNGLLEGIEKVYYKNGELSSLFNYKKGEKAGICKEFHPNGKLKSSCIYSDKPHDCSVYYSDGQLKEKGECMGTQKVGLWETYHQNGSISETGYYATSDYTTSMKHGLWKTYYPNGQLQTIGEYAKGIRHGQWIKYYEDGEKSDARIY